MSLVKSAFRGGLWFAAFTTVSQSISWCATLVIARMLTPADYGLMDMATILTGYVQIFYEMGVGAAIIQRDEVSDEELSSVFWALFFWGVVLGSLCFLLAYPTVLIFHEPRVYHVTQAVSVLFLLGTTFIVPGTLLKRQLRFKALGFVLSTSVVISCLAMVALAYAGAGIWTLIGGNIIRSALTLILVFIVSGWRPKLHFSHAESMAYLRFGLPVVGGNSLGYIYTRAAVFFGGRAFTASSLGYYSLATQLASIPNDKVLSVINSVSYPVFSRMQNDDWEFQRFYLRLSQFVAFIVLPLYAGGIFLAAEIIPWLLGDKWQASVLPFQILCVAFLFSALNSPSNQANTAQGRPHWTFWFQAYCAATMTGGFYLAAASGDPAYLAVPWLAILAPAQLIYSWITLRKVGIPVRAVLDQWRAPALATFLMLLILTAFRYGFQSAFESVPTCGAVYVFSAIGLGAAWYGAYMFMLQREFVQNVILLARPKSKQSESLAK